MSVVDTTERTLQVKIVYYGPGLSGKTTNLERLSQQLNPQRRGDLMVLDTVGDRTLFFDWMPVELGTIRGFDVKIQLYTVPGQVRYNNTRKRVLAGVDGIVFVADSQAEALDQNEFSLLNLRENLEELGIQLEDIPLVVQYNKRDLPSALPIEDLAEHLDLEQYPAVESVAAKGRGVLETLRLIVRLTLQAVKDDLDPNRARQKHSNVPMDGQALLAELMKGGGDDEGAGSSARALVEDRGEAEGEGLGEEGGEGLVEATGEPGGEGLGEAEGEGRGEREGEGLVEATGEEGGEGLGEAEGEGRGEREGEGLVEDRGEEGGEDHIEMEAELPEEGDVHEVVEDVSSSRHGTEQRGAAESGPEFQAVSPAGASASQPSMSSPDEFHEVAADLIRRLAAVEGLVAGMEGRLDELTERSSRHVEHGSEIVRLNEVLDRVQGSMEAMEKKLDLVQRVASSLGGKTTAVEMRVDRLERSDNNPIQAEHLLRLSRMLTTVSDALAEYASVLRPKNEPVEETGEDDSGQAPGGSES